MCFEASNPNRYLALIFLRIMFQGGSTDSKNQAALPDLLRGSLQMPRPQVIRFRLGKTGMVSSIFCSMVIIQFTDCRIPAVQEGRKHTSLLYLRRAGPIFCRVCRAGI